MGDHFDRSAPGMHTTDTIDYGVVVRGEMTLELDDGKVIHLRQGDCIVQNGTRHRWRNPLPEPCPDGLRLGWREARLRVADVLKAPSRSDQSLIVPKISAGIFASRPQRRPRLAGKRKEGVTT
jgi:hypothetical protein